MKNWTSLSIVFICFLSGILPHSLEAQTVTKCGITAVTTQYYAEHPEMIKPAQMADAQLEAEMQAKYAGQNAQMNACTDVMVIPVVFHVIHENGPENISDEKVFEAIRVLNEDFRLWNADKADIVSSFQPIIGDALIEFRLAQLDPSGNVTNGIDRIESSETNVGDNGSKLNGWPRDMYLNIWTTRVISNGAAAYSQLPSSVPFADGRDGIITRYVYVGKGERTITHETGHWLNLHHVWGSGNDAGEATNCSKDDGVNDTPLCLGTLGGCNETKNTCSSLDNVQNYMDYSSCEMMFTEGQVARMRVALKSAVAQRSSLSKASNLMATGVYEGAAQFSANLATVCPGNAVQYTDESYNGICQWNWTFQGGTPATSTDRQPLIVYSNPGSFDVTLTVSNDTGSTTTTIVDYMQVSGSETLPYSETFSGSSDWLVSGNASPTWEYASFTFDGDPGCMVLYNFGQGTKGDIDELNSPAIDLSVLETAQLTFEVAYAKADASSNDILRLYTSGDCGTTWNLPWIDGGLSTLASPNGVLTSNFVPNSTDDWKNITVNIPPPMLTENFRFKFKFTSDEGNNIFVDNINITGTYNSTPLLVSPVNFAVGQSTSQVLVDWDAVDNVDFYDYEIDKVNTFDSPFLIAGTSTYINTNDNGADTEYLVTGLDSSVQIYWKVRTHTGSDSSDWSSIWKFSTVPFAALSVPELQVKNISLIVYPNPSNGDVTVGFDLYKNNVDVSLQVFDVLGREISNPSGSDTQLSEGHHEFKLNSIQRSGVYYVKLRVDGSYFHSRFTISK